MHDIDELAGVENIGKVTIAKLKALGIEHVEDLVLFNPEELEELAGIDFERALRIVRAARRIAGWETKAYTGREYAALLQKRDALSSGVASIDELMGGGFTVYDIYEFAGEFGTGKTQLCHQLAVTVQLPPARGGLGGGAVYVDTEGTFSPERIEGIGERFGVEDPLSGIYVVRPLSVDELEEFVVRGLPKVLKSGARLVVIDSVIALYRAQFRGREWLAMRQQRINYMLDWLKRLSRLYGTVTVITNQVVSVPSAWGVAVKLPAGGNIIAHASTHRFLMKRTGETFLVEVLDSPRLPRGASAEFAIARDGLRDAR
ncbi:DNA repair and recombination protein RadA [Infirmifilum lucidum]|uniref:DNA repair and recombination protein RadA n=1 Tax=Infirmifilum lucidum TaxID=2776706 RepID=A0A7L9FI32_9CREN|nr:DNA repair and recombination protein RadA [Infirmifilum lucidum]QOJ79377.1 DNA repair and recombination protein RadA [Infirmifilum lucidum]